MFTNGVFADELYNCIHTSSYATPLISNNVGELNLSQHLPTFAKYFRGNILPINFVYYNVDRISFTPKFGTEDTNPRIINKQLNYAKGSFIHTRDGENLTYTFEHKSTDLQSGKSTWELTFLKTGASNNVTDKASMSLICNSFKLGRCLEPKVKEENKLPTIKEEDDECSGKT